jgi:ADP-ribosylglycohydrolase
MLRSASAGAGDRRGSIGVVKRDEPPEIRGSSYVVRSLKAALWTFHSSDSFREGLLLVVNPGEGADTTSVVYGQLAGAYYGEKAMPRSWRYRLAHRLLIEYLAERLFHLGRTIGWEKIILSCLSLDYK